MLNLTEIAEPEGLTDDDRARHAHMVAGIEKFIQGRAIYYARAYRVDCSDDLAQVGRLRALRCAITWRADGGANFLTYCIRLVSNVMQREAQELSNIVHIPTPKYFSHRISVVPLDAPLSDEEGADTVISSFVCDPVEPGTDRATIREVIDRKLAVLKPRDRAIITMRFFTGMTLQDIASEFKVTRQRIDQVVKKTLERWKNSPDFKRLAGLPTSTDS